MSSVDPIVPSCSLSDSREKLLPPSSSTSISVDGQHVLHSLGLLSTSATSTPSIPTTTNSIHVKEESVCDLSVESSIAQSSNASPQPMEVADVQTQRFHPSETQPIAIPSPAKRPRHKPGERKELLLMAVNDVLTQNISMRKAASRYNLAKSSLCDFVRKNNIKLPNNRSRAPTALPVVDDSMSPQIFGLDTNPADLHMKSDIVMNYPPAMRNLIASVAEFNGQKQQANAIGQRLHSATPPISLSNPILSKMESPWHNVHGLPTQVPIQNWSHLPLSHNNTSKTPRDGSTMATKLSASSDVLASSFPSPKCLMAMNSDEEQPHKINGDMSNMFSSPAFMNNCLSTAVNTTAAGLQTDILIPLNRPLFTVSQPNALASQFAAAQSFLQSTAAAVSSSINPTSSTPILLPQIDTDSASFSNLLFAAAASRGAANQNIRFDDSHYHQPTLPQQPQLHTDLFDITSKGIDFQNPDILFHLKSQPQQYFNALLQANRFVNERLKQNNMNNQTCSSKNINVFTQIEDLISTAPMDQAKELIKFINKSPSPFHVVRSACEILKNHDFHQLHENIPWKLSPNECFFVTKNNSSLFAVTVGGGYQPGNGFSVIGAHTDSPCLRLKPISQRLKEGYVELGVETYGGGLWYTWFDRDLTLSGRCVVRVPREGGGIRLEERLIHVKRPIACVPSLAIHLNREANKSFSPNLETHLAPILCTTIMEQIVNPTEDKEEDKEHHPTSLLRLIALELNCSIEDLAELELYFSDTQPACIGGLHSEFIHAPRLDNQFNAYTSIQALVNSLSTLKDCPNVRVVCLYDHEEIGSRSAQGANSVYTANLFRRFTNALAGEVGGVNDSLFERTMARSFILSADQAHAVHPSWPEKHEMAHKPGFHKGLVLKYHCSQNYATNGISAAICKEIARRAEVPIQEFVIKQDQICGGTIGPLMASQLGALTADIGGAQLAMHSCREMTDVTSVGHAISYFSKFFEHLPSIMQSMS